MRKRLYMLSWDSYISRAPWRIGRDAPDYLCCAIRKKWVVATPEEAVRQYALYLLDLEQYPATHLVVEKAFVYREQTRRIDLIAYDLAMKPFLVVECKKNDKMLDEKDFMQLISYNAVLKAPYLALFNGLRCLCFKQDSQSLSGQTPFTDHFPPYEVASSSSGGV